MTPSGFILLAKTNSLGIQAQYICQMQGFKGHADDSKLAPNKDKDKDEHTKWKVKNE